MYFIGVDLGGTNIASALVNKEGEILKEIIIPTEAYKGPEHVITQMKKIIQDLILNAPKAQVSGIGLGIPGLVDIDRGMSLFAGNLGWQNVSILEEFKKSFHIPLCMDNDVRVATLGEKYFGAGSGISNLLCVTLGTGVGSGIIINGKLYRGYSYSAGEIGHITVVKDGLYCNCGNRGCLEMYVSAPGIVRRTIKHIREGHNTIIASMIDGQPEKITPAIISLASEKGDELAKLIIEETAELLGIGLANYAQLLNPEMIIIGGGVSLMGDKLFIPLREHVRQRSMKTLRDKLQIVPAKLRNKSGMIGAATLSMLNLGVL